MPSPTACVVGHGAVGELHARLLTGLGLTVVIADPAPRLDPGQLPRWSAPTDLPPDLEVDLWSICTPTQSHLPALRAVLRRDPAARVLLEKPACLPGETAELTWLLEQHPRARLRVMDQYRHAAGPQLLRTLLAEAEPGAPLSALRIAFTKDRGPDIAGGRFVDTTYGVFGYEWPHMLALVSRFLDAPSFAAYLDSEPDAIEAVAEGSAWERTRMGELELELFSTVTGDTPRPGWTRPHRAGFGQRLRLVQATAGGTTLTLHLDPVALPGDSALPRNVHRITGPGPREWLVHDSPMDTAIRAAVRELFTPGAPPADDRALPVLRRIARLAAAAPASLETTR